MKCKVLFDECLPFALVEGLRRRLPNESILFVGGPLAPQKGTDDSELLRWCEEERCLFISSDYESLPEFVADNHRKGRHTYGVFIVRRGSKRSQILDDLHFIIEASEAEEWIDQYQYLPL